MTGGQQPNVRLLAAVFFFSVALAAGRIVVRWSLPMRVIWIYLVVYFALVVGAFVALAIGGVLSHLSFLPILVTFGGAIALGVLLAAVWFWNPAVHEDR